MKTLVLVDYNKDNLQFIKDALVAVAPEVKCLSLVFADEAIKNLRSGVIAIPDCILVNFNMPGRGSVEFITRLRADNKLKHVPVIVYANRVTLEIYRSVENFGCAMMIEKPRTSREWKIRMKEVVHSINGPEIDITPHRALSKEVLFATHG